MIGQNDNKPSISLNETKLYANTILEALHKNINKTTFLIGIGRQFKTISSIHKSFFEAHEAIRLMQKFDKNEGISHFEDYAVYHFLDSNIKDSQLESFLSPKQSSTFMVMEILVQVGPQIQARIISRQHYFYTVRKTQMFRTNNLSL